MRNRYRWSIGLVLTLAMSGAWAEGGRIEFYGAVVEPTCPADLAALASAPAQGGADASRHTCGRTAADPGRSFSRRVMPLDVATAANDRLLGYFASYAAGGDARLVVRTYE
jgi:hypothetical protein